MASKPIDLPPDYDAFKEAVISDQGHDDRGVYEVWWHANTWYPDQPLGMRLAIAESVVSELLRGGRIKLVQGEWIGPDHEREPVLDAEAALHAWITCSRSRTSRLCGWSTPDVALIGMSAPSAANPVGAHPVGVTW